MSRELITSGVEVDISGEKVKIDIYLNDSGNLVLEGIGSVTYEFYDDELCLYRYND